MIIFDLDGTLADCEHRRHFVDANKNPDYETVWVENEKTKNWSGTYRPAFFDCSDMPMGDEVVRHKITGHKFKPDWKAFYEACDKDTPILPVRDILWWLNPFKNKISIWSGRCESVREKTIEWIIDQIFLGNFITFEQIELKMRPVVDSTPDDVLKERWLDEAIAEGKTVEYVFDDRPKVIRFWRRRGIFVFDCNQSGKEF